MHACCERHTEKLDELFVDHCTWTVGKLFASVSAVLFKDGHQVPALQLASAHMQDRIAYAIQQLLKLFRSNPPRNILGWTAGARGSGGHVKDFDDNGDDGA